MLQAIYLIWKAMEFYTLLHMSSTDFAPTKTII